MSRASSDAAPQLKFRRLELKYFLPERWIAGFTERLAPYTAVDPYLVKEGKGRTRYPVTSLYFDSWDLRSWAEKEAGDLSRRKVRIRTYETTFREGGPNYLELKRRHDAVVLKDRARLREGTLARLESGEPLRSIEPLLDRASPVAAEANLVASWFNLIPTALVRYQRTALVAREDPRVRITIDHEIEAAWRPASILGEVSYRPLDSIFGMGLTGIAGRYAILELKSDGAFPPWLHRAICDLELARTAYSKYFLAVLVLRPTILEDCESSHHDGWNLGRRRWTGVA